ncbi:MAG: hypothetical protein HY749_09070 [Gammaproteobacteria bacterium]|nr:hypothetical protein [Gammaproteobacteria bacterium]MBI5616777.1 hypothetical protein [Gammaproteobacteria bacterium]
MSLHEIGEGRDTGDGLVRRWFAAPHLDIYVWQDAAGRVRRFQLCYELGVECALDWSETEGFTHHAVDGGESDPARNRSPLLVPDGAANRAAIAALVFGVRAELPSALYDFISARIDELPH